MIVRTRPYLSQAARPRARARAPALRTGKQRLWLWVAFCAGLQEGTAAHHAKLHSPLLLSLCQKGIVKCITTITTTATTTSTSSTITTTATTISTSSTISTTSYTTTSYTITTGYTITTIANDDAYLMAVTTTWYHLRVTLRLPQDHMI